MRLTLISYFLPTPSLNFWLLDCTESIICSFFELHIFDMLLNSNDDTRTRIQTVMTDSEIFILFHHVNEMLVLKAWDLNIDMLIPLQFFYLRFRIFIPSYYKLVTIYFLAWLPLTCKPAKTHIFNSITDSDMHKNNMCAHSFTNVL